MVTRLHPLPSDATGVAPDTLLTPAEAASFLRIKQRQLQRLGVPVIRLGHRTLRYSRVKVERWLAERIEQP